MFFLISSVYLSRQPSAIKGTQITSSAIPQKAIQNAIRTRIHKAALQLFAQCRTTEINVSELADLAGVARGTVCNHLPHPEVLFAEIAAQLVAEMNELATQGFGCVEDPTRRLVMGLKLYANRAHDEPNWGRFITRFAYGAASLQAIWADQPLRDLLAVMGQGRYEVRTAQLPSAIALVAGAVIGTVFLVLEGSKTWIEASENAAELTLIALGEPGEEARQLACEPLSLPAFAPNAA